MKKKILSLALALAMCLGLTVPVFAAGAKQIFEDTSGKMTLSQVESEETVMQKYNSSSKNASEATMYTAKQGVTLTVSDDVFYAAHVVLVRAVKDSSGAYVGTDEELRLTKGDVVLGPEHAGAWLTRTGFAMPIVLYVTDDAIPAPVADSNFTIENGVLTKYNGPGGDVVIPDGVTEIGGSAFSVCESLTSVTIPNGVTKIGNFAFGHCVNLTSATIPDSVTWIGSGGFGDTFKLADVYYGGTKEQWESISSWAGIHEPTIVHYNSAGPAQPEQPATPVEPEQPSKTEFADVKSGDFFAAPVQWALENNITAGTSKTKFSPNSKCNRAQILAFLWRASGSPEPTVANPFGDIKESDFYYKAALWAVEKGIVSGTTFDALTPCTRSSTMEYMWKAAGSPTATYDGKFNDVAAGSDYAQAVAWALENNITAGTSKTKFSPNSTCTRGQIVTFLYRAFAE